ncbi:MAG: (d)CMP kinase [Dehalococcoidia bacterium]
MAIRDRELERQHPSRALPRLIAIDGPSAAGKSSVGHRLAQRLGYDFLDTGAMYRALTRLALDRGIDPSDTAALAYLARHVEMETGPPPSGADESSIRADGRDITPLLREPSVEEAVSLVSCVPEVRQALVDMQRRIAACGPMVMTGRDIGTVVLPKAELKVYLDASPEERAHRRYLELKAMGRQTTPAQVLAEVRRRDSIDQGREESPLRPAPDAIVISTDGLPLEQVVERILQLIEVVAKHPRLKPGASMPQASACGREELCNDL